MKRLSGPLPPRPAVTCSRRRITPFFRASAPDGVFTSGMMSGSVTWSRSCVHPWSDSSSSAAMLNEPSGCRVMGRYSERYVQAERPVGGRRLGLEVADDPRRPAEVVSLRIDPRKLGGPPEISARDREAQSVRTHRARDGGGKLVRHRRLPQPQEIRPLDVAILRRRAD